jgi:hypothetical protein
VICSEFIAAMETTLQLTARKPQIRELMLGGAGIAGMFHIVTHEQAVQALEKAVELGITQFDTAPVCIWSIGIGISYSIRCFSISFVYHFFLLLFFLFPFFSFVFVYSSSGFAIAQ